MKRKIDRLKQAPALKIKMPQLLLYNRNKINFLQPWRPTKEAELIRARDDAFAQVKTATEEAQKAADDIRNIRLQNTSIQSLTKVKSVADSEHESAIVAAVADA
ncbi:hypothetical protein JOM56_005044 [Amanita muscaria]